MYYIINNNKNTNIEFKLGVLLEEEDILIKLINDSLLSKPNERVSDIKVESVLNEMGIKYIKFESKSQFKKKFYDKMEKLALYDGDVRFNELIGKLDEKFIERLNYLQRSMNYNQMYLNRIIDINSGKVYAGCVVHSVGNIVGGRITMEYTNKVDEYPFLVAKRVIGFMKESGRPHKIDKIIFGYDYNLSKIEEYVKIVVAKPNKNIVELENMQIINQYILNGYKILPIQEVLNE